MHAGYDNVYGDARPIIPDLPVSEERETAEEQSNSGRELSRAVALIGAVLVGLLLFAVGAGIYSAKPFQAPAATTHLAPMAADR